MDSSKKLYKTADFYRQQGYSVVPIHGDNVPEKFKAAAVRWQAFQKRLPTHAEIEDWFLKQQHGGLAIVCGAISGLAVLDFDDPDLAHLFSELHPDLAQTRLVRSGSRQLPHYYYHISQSANKHSRSLHGVDWQCNGRYVVAPPTTGAVGSWTVERDITPLFLSEADLSRIHAFLDATDQMTGKKPLQALSGRSSAIPASTVSVSAALSPAAVISYYRAHVTYGRNNALFRTACWIRDRGGSRGDAAPLIDVHAHEAPIWDHPPETPEKRRVEALRTIESAFSRPPAYRAKPKYTVIPNSLREAMLARKQTPLLRILECAVKAGWRTDQTFSRADVIALAKANNIGDWSVRRALATLAPDDAPVFHNITPADTLTATGANAAAGCGAETPQLNAVELSETKPTQNRGRPPKCYKMPDLRDLCVRYDVRWTNGDDLDAAAVRSAAGYRKALHVALLRRRPGQYYRSWLAKRLGMSVRTICRYNQSENVIVKPMYLERRINWRNLGDMPHDLHDYPSPVGAFIYDETGKRYPPFMPIVYKLLRNKKQVTFARQIANHYSLPGASLPDAAELQPEVSPLSAKTLPQPETPPLIPYPFDAVPITETPFAKALMALTECEKDAASQLKNASRGTLSLRRAEQLVARYGRLAALDILETLTQRGDDVKNPGGFITALINARYGFDPERTLTTDDVARAESLYILAEWHTPDHKLRWDTCLNLVQTNSPKAITDLIQHLNIVERGTLHNAAGYIITHLRRSQPLKLKSTEDAITAMMTTTRDICPQHSMSRKTAESLAAQHSFKLIAKALNTLRTRTNIENPTGFVITFLRSEAKAQEREAERRRRARYIIP